MSIDATLYVDGTRLADGSPGDDELAPTALSGLTMTWGRTTTVDQPEPSSCSFDVMDLAGGDTFLGRLYVGATVQVRAAGTVEPEPTQPATRDPSFEAVPAGTVLDWDYPYSTWTNVVTVDTARAATGAQSARMDPVPTPGNQFREAFTVIPPAPHSASPAAWDDLPQAIPGQWWRVQLACWLPAPRHVALGFRRYASPTDRSPRQIGIGGGTRWIPGTNGWQTIARDFEVPDDAAGGWLGATIQLDYETTWSAAGPLGAWDDAPLTWADYERAWIDDVQILAPDDAIVRDVVVFDGRITEVDAGWDDSIPGVVCSVVATDFTADLANRDLGDVPWPAEPVSARFAKILAAAGVTIPYTIAPTLAGVRVSWLDIDNQQCWPLLADLATTTDGVLWSATHATTGPYLYLADPAVLSALYRLQLVDGLVVVVPTLASDAAVMLDACDVLLDPVTFRQATSDVTTRAVITWKEQTVDDGGQPAPTDRTVTVVDVPLEAQLGTRRIGITTQLTTQAAAQSLADRVLARLHRQSWRVAGLTWDTNLSDMDPDQTGRALDLLDGTRRLAAPVILTNLPDWSPTGPTVPLFLQGGTYTFDGGAWSLDLTTASAQSQGTSLPWTAVDPAWAWNAFDPAMAWDDLIGVAP